MAAIATVALNNGSTNVNFTPSSVLGNIAEWEYLGGSLFYGGRQTLTLSVNKSAKSKVVRVKATVNIPVMDGTVEGQVNGTIRADINIIVPKLSTAMERSVGANLVKAFVASAPFQTAVADLAATY
jgi:hypothetical protein